MKPVFAVGLFILGLVFMYMAFKRQAPTKTNPNPGASPSPGNVGAGGDT